MNDLAYHPAERRRYYRIDDEVALRYRAIDESELERELARFQIGYPDKLSLASAFASTSTRMRRSMDQFKRDLPEVADYLGGLNEKLDLLVQLLAASDSDLTEGPTHGVNLSASGISFHAPEPLPEDTIIEIKLLVFPTYVCMLCFGRVVRCRRLEPGARAGWDVGVEFTHIREADRELIFKHVTKRQSEILREAKSTLVGAGP